MINNNEAFDKWVFKNMHTDAPNFKLVHTFAKEAWQALKADSDKEIQAKNINIEILSKRILELENHIENLSEALIGRDQEIEELRDRLNKIATDWQVMKIELKSAYELLTEYNMWDVECKEKIADLTTQNAKLREALQFYSDCNHFDNQSDGSIEIADHGEIADEALASTKELNK